MINVQIDLLARSRAHQAKNTDFYLLPNINQIQQVFFFHPANGLLSPIQMDLLLKMTLLVKALSVWYRVITTQTLSLTQSKTPIQKTLYTFRDYSYTITLITMN